MKFILLPLFLGMSGAALGWFGGNLLHQSAKPNATDSKATGDSNETQDGSKSGDVAPGKDASGKPAEAAAAKASDGPQKALEGPFEYVKMNNQFVVPVVRDNRVRSLVILSLSLEVPAGAREGVYAIEPRLRDSILAILLHHSNAGGFDGHFSDLQTMGELRTAMRNTAFRTSEGVVNDVLILDIVRQDVQ